MKKLLASAALLLALRGEALADALTFTTTGSTNLALPPSGTLLVANQPITVSGDCTGSGTTAITLSCLTGGQTVTLSGDTIGSGGNAITTTTLKVNGVSYPASPGTNTVPVATGGGIVTYETAPVAAGGTGATSLAAHGVLLGEGTNPASATAPGTLNQVLTSNGASADPTYQSPPIDIAAFVPGVPSNGMIARVVVTRAIILPSGLTNSMGVAKEGATASTTVAINKISGGISTPIGTAVFAASGGTNATGTFTAAAATSLAAGDMVELAYPATADATLGDIAITLAGTHL